MMENGLLINIKIQDKEKEDKFGQMDPCMKVGGKTTKQMVKAG